MYALSKGLNSGKLLDNPCPNCFVISCNNAKQKDIYRSLLFGLWQTNSFHQFLVGSVISFIRIDDFRDFIFEQARHLQGKEEVFQNDIIKVKSIEEKEKQMYQQLLLISELKRFYIARHLKR